MERKIQAIRNDMAAMQGVLSQHLVDCRKSSLDLQESVATVVEWAKPQMIKAHAKALLWQKISDTVVTESMTALIKWGALFVVVAILMGSIPAGKALLRYLGF